MTIPVWVLLGFAGWTLILLLNSVGIYRWSRILTGRADIKHWRADKIDDAEKEWYRRAMRAHANCVENLPVYGAIVVAIVVSGADSRLLNIAAITLLVARVAQSTVHVALEQTNVVAGFRFAFFFIQVLCMFAMGISVAVQAM